MSDAIKLKTVTVLQGIIYGGLLVALYYSSHRFMIQHWNGADYSYCYLIPFVVLYLLWEKRELLNRIPARASWTGFLPLAFGLGLFWLGELGGEYYTLYLSSWFVLLGLCWMHLGWRKLRVVLFPMVFIVTMFPPPNFISFNLSLKLKLISSQVGVWMLHAAGKTVYREGNIIDLGFTQLQVVDACSGLRYLLPLIILGILLAYCLKAAVWKKIVVVISTIPLSIITNGLRIAVTGILYEVWGPKIAEGFFHGFSGWVIFVLSLGVLEMEMWVLNKIGGKNLTVENNGKRLKEKQEKWQVKEDGVPASAEMKGRIKFWSFLHPPQFIVAVILLGTTLGLFHGVEFREKIPIAKSFDRFPLTIGEWNGTRDTMEQRFIDELDLSDYVLVNYTNQKHQEINFYVAYNESQSKGKATHSPETCLPGSGWSFERAGLTGIPTGNGKMIEVNRAFIKKGGERNLVYFWFPQRGRVLTNLYQVKLYNFWDALTKKRTDGALVRIITPVNEFETLAQADERLKGFVREIIPVLSAYIPGKEVK